MASAPWLVRWLTPQENPRQVQATRAMPLDPPPEELRVRLSAVARPQWELEYQTPYCGMALTVDGLQKPVRGSCKRTTNQAVKPLKAHTAGVVTSDCGTVGARGEADGFPPLCILTPPALRATPVQ